MITQRFGFTKDFTKKWNNSVYSRLSKMLCGFKDQVRARPSGEKCGLKLASMDEIAKPDQLLENLADDLKILLVEREIDDPLMVGIHTGGAWIATSCMQSWAFHGRWPLSISAFTAMTFPV